MAQLRPAVFGLVVCGAAGVVAATSFGLQMVAALVTVAVAWCVWRFTHASVFAVATLFVWSGYVLFSRDFADLHFSIGPLPIYVGEMLLLGALPWALTRIQPSHVARNAFFVALFAWMGYCALRLLAGGLAYGIDALRDSAIWYYGLFAIVGYVVWQSLSRSAWMRYFGFLFGALLVLTVASFASESLDLPLKVPREDVLAATLLAAANFFLLALRSARFTALRLIASSVAIGLMLPLEVRSATVGVLLLMGIFVVQRRWSTLVAMVAIPSIAFALLAVANVPLSGRVGGSTAGDLLNRQLTVISLAIDGRVASNDPALPHDATSGTAVWRYNWWTALIGDTLSTPEKALFGVGFGTDITWPLGIDQSNAERPLRSPHNIAVNIFTRTGALGLGLWLTMLGTWVWRVLRAIRVDQSADGDYLLWMTTYVVTILAVALFGVVLEGPFAAIPFFLLMGMAVRQAHELVPATEPHVRSAVSSRRLAGVATSG